MFKPFNGNKPPYSKPRVNLPKKNFDNKPQQNQSKPPEQQRGPNFQWNKFNRQNKAKKQALLAQKEHAGSSGLNHKEKVNLTQFANMAICDNMDVDTPQPSSSCLIDRIAPVDSDTRKLVKSITNYKGDYIKDNFISSQKQCIDDDDEPLEYIDEKTDVVEPIRQNSVQPMFSRECIDALLTDEPEESLRTGYRGNDWTKYVFLTTDDNIADHKSVMTSMKTMVMMECNHGRSSSISRYQSSTQCATNVIKSASLLQSDYISEEYWMIDSGASIHITNEINDFTDYAPYLKPELVTTANKKSVTTILGEGTVFCHLEDSNQNLNLIKLKVCYMPMAFHKLLSASQLKINGYTEISNSDHMIFSLKGKKMIIAKPKLNE